MVSAQKLKCPGQLNLARQLFSSAQLSSGNFSSNSSLNYLGQIVHGFKYLLRFPRRKIDNSDEESQKRVVFSSMHVLVSKTQLGQTQSLYEVVLEFSYIEVSQLCTRYFSTLM